jgi:hypothetical protein
MFVLTCTAALGCGEGHFASGAGDGAPGPEASGGSGTGDSGASDGQTAGADGARAVSSLLRIQNDADDGVWLDGTTERTHHGADLFTLEVGADSEAARTGLIFRLPVPPRSVINSARVTLHRVDGDAGPSDTMLVEVWDSCHVDPFNDAHVHTPDQHVPGGFWSTAVTGFAVGANGSDIVSPDLASLVQHVVDKPDWTAGATVGVFLAPATMQGWVMVADSSAGTGAASLQLSHTPP